MEDLEEQLKNIDVRSECASVLTIRIENNEIKVSKDEVLDYCGYFKAMFEFEKEKNVIEIKGGIDHKVAELILTNLDPETVRDKINVENVQDVLLGAIFLQCQIFEKACESLMLASLDWSNACSVLLLAHEIGSNRLLQATDKFIRDGLTSIYFKPGPSLTILTQDHIQNVLCRVQDLNVAYWIILGWVRFNQSNRVHLVNELLMPWPFELLPSSSVSEVNCDEIRSMKTNYDLLHMKEKRSYWIKRQTGSFWPQCVVICSAGCLQQNVAMFSKDQNSLIKLTAKPQHLKRHSSGSQMVALKDSVYFIGGEKNLSSYVYNLTNDIWLVLDVEQKERVRPLVVASRNMIYLFGGYSCEPPSFLPVYHNDASVLDPERQEWVPLKAMRVSRSGGQALAVGNRIFLIGGLSQSRQSISEVEVYDIDEDAYESVTNLPRPMTDFTAVYETQSKKIYLIGGLDPMTFETLATVQVYDVITQEWSTDFPKLNCARKSCVASLLAGTLYVFGGSTADLGVIKTSERFNPCSNQWEVFNDKLPKLSGPLLGGLVDFPVRLMDNYEHLGQSNVRYRKI